MDWGWYRPQQIPAVIAWLEGGSQEEQRLAEDIYALYQPVLRIALQPSQVTATAASPKPAGCMADVPQQCLCCALSLYQVRHNMQLVLRSSYHTQHGHPLFQILRSWGAHCRLLCMTTAHHLSASAERLTGWFTAQATQCIGFYSSNINTSCTGR